MEIIIIDDEEIVGVRLKAALEKLGHQVEQFTDSVRAMEVIARRHFDIVISDIKMPGVNGMEIFTLSRSSGPMPG